MKTNKKLPMRIGSSLYLFLELHLSVFNKRQERENAQVFSADALKIVKRVGFPNRKSSRYCAYTLLATLLTLLLS